MPGVMLALVVNGLLLLSFGVPVQPAEVMVLGSDSRATLLTDRELLPKRCRYSRSLSVLEARCGDLGLSEIPKNLQTDIESLDFSVNRLRELKNETLGSYTSLAYLYLQDNFIQTIEEGSFNLLRRLDTIDLTKNGCQDFPKSTLSLPYLRKLYLAENKLTDGSFEKTPLSEDSKLEFLKLSKNQLKRLPSLGSLPSLKYLNVSGNLITSVTTEDIAPFCSLEILDLTSNPIKFDKTNCDCENVNLWIELRKIKMIPTKIPCNTNEKKSLICGNSKEPEVTIFSNETMKLYESCRNVIKTRAETAKARSTWILIASCVGTSIVLLFLALYCIHKRNNRKKKRQRLKQEQQLASNNANTELLNGNFVNEQT